MRQFWSRQMRTRTRRWHLQLPDSAIYFCLCFVCSIEKNPDWSNQIIANCKQLRNTSFLQSQDTLRLNLIQKFGRRVAGTVCCKVGSLRIPSWFDFHSLMIASLTIKPWADHVWATCQGLAKVWIGERVL